MNPATLRRIRYFDENLGKRFVFLTNNFELSASTVAALYKSCRLTEEEVLDHPRERAAASAKKSN